MTAGLDHSVDDAAGSVRPARWHPGSPIRLFAVAGVAALVAFMAWTTPVSRHTTVMVPSSSMFTFDYETVLTANQPVYEGGVVDAGEPIFFEVLDVIEVTTRYTAGSGTLPPSDGELQLRVVARSSAGWTRELIRSEPVALVAGRPATDVAVLVDFGNAKSVAEELTRATEVPGTLTVEVIAEVGITPTAAALRAPSFGQTATLTFDVSDRVARPSTRALVDPNASTPGARRQTGSPDVPDSGLTTSVNEMVPLERERTETMGVGVLAMSVTAVRWISTLMAAVTLAWALASMAALGQAAARSESAFLVARYGRRLVSVRPPQQQLALDHIDVVRFDELLAMADHLDQPITYTYDSHGAEFRVQDVAVVYRYRAASNRPDVVPYGAVRSDDDLTASP